MSEFRFGPGRILSVRDFGTYRWYGFHCPACKQKHIFQVGKEPSWSFDGNEQAPTFSPSIKVGGVKDAACDPTPKVCHSFVRAGRIEFLGDCTHELAGQTVQMVPIPES